MQASARLIEGAQREQEESEMAIERLRAVTVWVNDVDAALAFYTEQVGLEKTMDVRYGDKGRWLTVAPAGSGGPQISISPAGYGGEPGGFTGLVLETSDVEGTVEELKGRGVSFTSEVTTNKRGAQMCDFEDPDGNGFRLHSS
jgi:lactoylglutathione lyase